MIFLGNMIINQKKKNKEKNTNHKIENKNNNNHNNNNNIYILNEKFDDNLEIFMDVKIPLYDFWENVKRNVLTTILILIGLFGTIITNLIVFYIKKINVNIPHEIWKYIVPILIYIIREILSKLFKKLNDIITNEEKFYIRKEYFYSKLKKQLFFEFINYYFNLYYIAFIKKFYGTCLNDNCHFELGNQLIIIIICDLVVLIISIFIPALFNYKQRKDFDAKIKDEDYEENCSNKYKYYTRRKFEYSDMKSYYIKAILYFGYIIQFGASAPMSFILVLFAIMLNRIILGISLKNIYFAQTFEESIGIYKLKKWIKIISFIGIISNLCCIFYTNNFFFFLR